MLASGLRHLRDLPRAFRTASHLRRGQIAHRAWRVVRGEPAPRLDVLAERRSDDLPARLHLLRRFAFRDGLVEAVGQRLPLADGWEPPHAPSRLWLYHLHYFDWLRQDDLPTAVGLEHIRSWISDHWRGTGWDPYPSSRRIVNWMCFQIERGVRDPVIDRSLFAQVLHLERTMEGDLLANHLLANLKALLFAARFFDGPVADRLWVRASEQMQAQVEAQTLSDGGHEERAPMYHMQVLEDLLDVVAFLPEGEPLVAYLRDAAARMMGVLLGILHPDGSFPLLGDSALGMVPEPWELSGYASALGIPTREPADPEQVVLPETGICRVSRGPFCLVARIGAIGADHQPGHAHADSCTFELSVAGRRLVVDTGCGHYEPGEERSAMRSTAAHSTVEIDGRDSSEVWASHRVGRRARPLVPVVRRHGDSVVTECGHDGYRFLPGGPVHRRSFEVSPQAFSIQDHVVGVGRHQVRWRVHLAPGLEVTAASPDVVLVSGPEMPEVVVRATLPGALRVVETSHYPRFGTPLARSCLEAVARETLPISGTMRFELAP